MPQDRHDKHQQIAAAERNTARISKHVGEELSLQRKMKTIE
ncbi:unnamed protein product [Onchocerca flexuosa]|uniref:V-SNARE coiled-coil homology domain-containing protein n=1 Tax=Onchocerca flexuosa TaxID=387005 RepID=A0A183I462_9BILA|nr:unnamed protein product [Onchocerca flexuosa]